MQERHKSTKTNPIKMDINSSQVGKLLLKFLERDESAPQKEEVYKIVRHSKNQLFDNK